LKIIELLKFSGRARRPNRPLRKDHLPEVTEVASLDETEHGNLWFVDLMIFPKIRRNFFILQDKQAPPVLD
jgi:hypothetical protein